VLVAGVTPEAELLRKERALEAERTLSEIVCRSRQDAVVTAIIGAMRDGATTRREIVQATGQSAADIDNGLKRLRRLGANVAVGKKERMP
jgi:Trp operon repressor